MKLLTAFENTENNLLAICCQDVMCFSALRHRTATTYDPDHVDALFVTNKNGDIINGNGLSGDEAVGEAEKFTADGWTLLGVGWVAGQADLGNAASNLMYGRGSCPSHISARLRVDSCLSGHTSASNTPNEKKIRRMWLSARSGGPGDGIFHIAARCDFPMNFVGSERPVNMVVAYLQMYRNASEEVASANGGGVVGRISQAFRATPISALPILEYISCPDQDSTITELAGPLFAIAAAKHGFWNMEHFFGDAPMFSDPIYNKGGIGSHLAGLIQSVVETTQEIEAVVEILDDLRDVYEASKNLQHGAHTMIISGHVSSGVYNNGWGEDDYDEDDYEGCPYNRHGIRMGTTDYLKWCIDKLSPKNFTATGLSKLAATLRDIQINIQNNQ